MYTCSTEAASDIRRSVEKQVAVTELLKWWPEWLQQISGYWWI